MAPIITSMLARIAGMLTSVESHHQLVWRVPENYRKVSFQVPLHSCSSPLPPKEKKENCCMRCLPSNAAAWCNRVFMINVKEIDAKELSGCHNWITFQEEFFPLRMNHGVFFRSVLLINIWTVENKFWNTINFVWHDYARLSLFRPVPSNPCYPILVLTT